MRYQTSNLSKRRGKAEDAHGCEFGYTVYRTGRGDDARYRYVADCGVTADALADLRAKMSAL